MGLIIAVVLLVLLLGGSGCYYGYSRYGGPGVDGILGTLPIIVLAVWLVGGVHFYH